MPHPSSLERQLTGQHRTVCDLRSRERFSYLGWLSHNKPQPGHKLLVASVLARNPRGWVASQPTKSRSLRGG